MRFQKHSLLAKTVFSVLASISILTLFAAAEDGSGKFVLTRKVHWGTVVLPPGEYTYKLERHSSQFILVRAAGGAPGFMMMASSISSTVPGKPDSLQLQKLGDEWFVQSMNISGLEEELHFRVQPPRTEVTSVAGSTRMASLSKPWVTPAQRAGAVKPGRSRAIHQIEPHSARLLLEETMLKRSRSHRSQKTAPTLRTVAEVVGLAPCSVSAILNNSAAALAIPEHTKERVFEAVRQLDYRPNLAARSLRTRRSYMVALVASDLGNAQTARIVAGVEGFLRAKGYLMVACNWDRTAQAGHTSQLLQRGIEGIITVDATLPKSMTLPLVFIDLPTSDMPQPITVLKSERLLAMGEAAAQSLLAQIEQKTGHFTRVSLSPEPTVGVFPQGVGIAVQRVSTAERFVD